MSKIVKRVVKKKVPKTTNNITKGIVNYLLNRGHSASRINTTGTYREGIGYTYSGARVGYLDISACIKTRSGIGLFLAIDVKKDDDKPRKEQKDFAKEVAAAGGLIFFADDVDHFIDYYENNLLPNYINKL